MTFPCAVWIRSNRLVEPDMMQTIFINGDMKNKQTLAEIRSRLRGYDDIEDRL